MSFVHKVERVTETNGSKYCYFFEESSHERNFTWAKSILKVWVDFETSWQGQSSTFTCLSLSFAYFWSQNLQPSQTENLCEAPSKPTNAFSQSFNPRSLLRIHTGSFGGRRLTILVVSWRSSLQEEATLCRRPLYMQSLNNVSGKRRGRLSSGSPKCYLCCHDAFWGPKWVHKRGKEKSLPSIWARFLLARKQTIEWERKLL